jgi:hypothetical protein
MGVQRELTAKARLRNPPCSSTVEIEEEEEGEKCEGAGMAAVRGRAGEVCVLSLGLVPSRSSSVSPTLASELIAEMEDILSSSSWGRPW